LKRICGLNFKKSIFWHFRFTQQKFHQTRNRKVFSAKKFLHTQNNQWHSLFVIAFGSWEQKISKKRIYMLSQNVTCLKRNTKCDYRAVFESLKISHLKEGLGFFKALSQLIELLTNVGVECGLEWGGI
jgi:hypothetical protein